MKRNAWSALLGLTMVSAPLGAQVIVTPSNLQGWGADSRHDPSAAGSITGDQPNNTNGSLKLYTAAATDRSNFAVDNAGAQGFGLFKDLNSVSVDWLNTSGGPGSTAIRLYLTTTSLKGLGAYFGYLGWYDTDPNPNQVPGQTITTPGTGNWVSSTASSDGWWFRSFNDPANGNYSYRNRPISCAANQGTNSYNDRMQLISAWISACGSTFGGEELFVDRIAVGIGADYANNTVFVDNLSVGFSNQQGRATYAYNFEVSTSTVPEPSTYALMASGLLALGLVARRRRVVTN